MLVLLRIIFTGAFIYCVVQARENARENLAAGDLENAFWVAVGVLAAIASAITWAPYLGAKVADPLTGGLVQTPPAERKNYLMLLVRWLDKRCRPGALINDIQSALSPPSTARTRHSALIRWLCFVEGVRAPWLPTAFILGLAHSRPGSWLERVYALEVFRFNNAENCMRAFEALQRHGIDPRPHQSPEVNLVLLSSERSVAPDPQKLDVPEAPPPPPLQRDERLQIGTE